jgi:glycyl-tRNA synthetase alpha chain
LERLAAFLQVKDSVYDIVWAPGATYRDVRFQDELQYSVYNFEMADVEKTWEHLRAYEAECKSLLDAFEAAKKAKDAAALQRFPVLAAFDLCLKCSHLFNLLDARGAISVTERVGVIARLRALAVGVARAYVEQQSLSNTKAGPMEDQPALAAKH